MSVRVERLEWDSEFWAQAVGRVYVDGPHDLSEFHVGLKRAREDFDFVQVLIPADQIDDVIAAEDAGFRVVDVRCVVGLDHLDDVPAPDSTEPVETCRHDQLDAVAELASTCHTVSRFANDPCLDPARTADLYRRWVHRDAGKGWTVAVTRDHGAISGYVTCGTEGQIGTVGVVGVAAQSRRSGLGRALIHYASHRCRLDGATSMRIVTQAGNAAAMATYRTLGYGVVEVGLWAHWHRPSPGDRG